MRIAITDDSAADRTALLALLKRYCAGHGLEAEFVCFSSAQKLLAAVAPRAFELLCLDIYMDGETGMEAARQINRTDPACRIIFYTTSQTHAVASYTVRAAWYLVKPVEYPLLACAMDAVCADLLSENRRVTLHSDGAALSVPLKQVLFVDCVRERAMLHLKNKSVPLDERVREVLDLLAEDERFLLCNRNVAVNMDWVERAQEGDFLMKDGQSVPMRQRGRTELKKIYLGWTLRTLREGGGL